MHFTVDINCFGRNGSVSSVTLDGKPVPRQEKTLRKPPSKPAATAKAEPTTSDERHIDKILVQEKPLGPVLKRQRRLPGKRMAQQIAKSILTLDRSERTPKRTRENE